MKHFKGFFVLSMALVLAGQGCFSGSGTPTAAPGGGSGSVRMGDCSHPYMPLAPGSSITYTSTGADEPVNYTQSVTSNSGNQASLRYDFEGHEVSLDHNINCRPDGIYSEGYLDFGSALGGAGITTETTSASGPMLPEGLRVGSEWSNHFETVGRFTDPSLPVTEITQSLDINRRAVRTERVTVPAGSYEALVVEAQFSGTSETGFGSLPVSFTQTEYWVEGIGMVKSVGSSPVGGDTVIEATNIIR